MGSQPRVTRFKINWEDGTETNETMEQEMPETADTCSTASPVKTVAQTEPEWGTDSQNSIPKTFVF